jgi:TM2 domain-containing membrane protein YozV
MAEAEVNKPKFRHISDVDVWLTPDRNYLLFICLSVFCGFFALDHIYLRSYQTAFQKISLNFWGLGLWYFWDLIQIFTDGRKVQTEGLSSPFDWVQGIGRGIFADPNAENKYTPEKSYIIWTFLTIFGGFLALDKFYLGDYFHGITKILTVFFPLFTLFGLLWVGWDMFHAIFMAKETIVGKISLPMPLTWFGYNETDGGIFLPTEPKAAGVSGIASAIAGISEAQTINLLAMTGIPALAGTVGKFTAKINQLSAKASAVTDAASSMASAAANPAALLPKPKINAGSGNSGTV